MSATLDAERVAQFLGDCPIVRVPGRTHAVEIQNENATLLLDTGENFIAPVKLRLNTILLPDAKWVDGNTITATLPANLPFGRYDVFVTNADGPENALYGALVIGTETFAPVLMR